MLTNVYMKGKVHNTFNHYSPMFMALDGVEFIRNVDVQHSKSTHTIAIYSIS